MTVVFQQRVAGISLNGGEQHAWYWDQSANDFVQYFFQCSYLSSTTPSSATTHDSFSVCYIVEQHDKIQYLGQTNTACVLSHCYPAVGLRLTYFLTQQFFCVCNTHTHRHTRTAPINGHKFDPWQTWHKHPRGLWSLCFSWPLLMQHTLTYSHTHTNKHFFPSLTPSFPWHTCQGPRWPLTPPHLALLLIFPPPFSIWDEEGWEWGN